MVVMVVVVTILFFTSRFGAVSENDAARSLQDFYGRTVNAMDRKRGSGGAQIIMDGKGSTSNGAVNDAKDKDGDGTVSEGDVQMAQEMQERLRAAEQKAKEQANKKAPLRPDSPSNVIGVGSSAGGQVQKPGGKDVDGSSTDGDLNEPSEDRKMEATLNEIFKRSPGKKTVAPQVSSLVRQLTRFGRSRHLLQVVLPLFEESQDGASRQIHHRSCALRG